MQVTFILSVMSARVPALNKWYVLREGHQNKSLYSWNLLLVSKLCAMQYDWSDSSNNDVDVGVFLYAVSLFMNDLVFFCGTAEACEIFVNPEWWKSCNNSHIVHYVLLVVLFYPPLGSGYCKNVNKSNFYTKLGVSFLICGNQFKLHI